MQQKARVTLTSGFCPDCDRKIALNPAKVGQLLTCPHCDVQLEVISVDPLEFDWAYDWTWEDEEEDDDEDDDEDEQDEY